MLRRNVRLRKEYLYKKSLEDKENSIRDRKARIKRALDSGVAIAPEDRNFELEKRGKLDLEDASALSQCQCLFFFLILVRVSFYSIDSIIVYRLF